MTTNMVDRRLRFSDVVYAIDATPKTLRNWLQRGQVVLTIGDHDGSGWREFSVADVAVLAVVRKLVEFGLTVEAANDFAHAVLIVSADELLLEQDAPPHALADHYASQAIVVWRANGEWMVRLDRTEERPQRPADAYLVLHLEPLLRTSIQRAFAGRADRGDRSERPSEAAGHAAAAVSKLGIAAEEVSEIAGAMLHHLEKENGLGPRASAGRRPVPLMEPTNTTTAGMAAKPKMETSGS